MNLQGPPRSRDSSQRARDWDAGAHRPRHRNLARTSALAFLVARAAQSTLRAQRNKHCVLAGLREPYQVRTSTVPEATEATAAASEAPASAFVCDCSWGR